MTDLDGELERLAASLGRRLYRFDCPDPQTIGDYELDLLPPEARTGVAAHVLECAHCAGEVAVLRQFLRREPALEATTALSGVAGGVRRLVASLLPPPNAAYAGLRGASTADVKTYQARNVTVTLGPGPTVRRGRASIMGLITIEGDESPPFTGGEARLIPADNDVPPQTAAVDELGNFAFEELPPGRYAIDLVLDELTVALPDLRVAP